MEFDWFTEQGRILMGHSAYEIRKHGWFSGHWTCETNGLVVANAHKPSAMFRKFDLIFGSDATGLILEAESVFGRAFEIRNERHSIGRIAPDHPFTRRATIECADEVPAHIQLFAFWLVALAWKRAAKSSSGSAS